jgi:hypothetical protein
MTASFQPGETLLFFPVMHRDEGGHLKNMLLFFDDARLVAPKRTKERAWAIDEAIYGPLEDVSLLADAELGDVIDLAKLRADGPDFLDQPDGMMRLMLAQLWQQFQQTPASGGEGGAMDMLTPTGFILLFHCAKRQNESSGHFMSPGTDTPEMANRALELFADSAGQGLRPVVEADIHQVGVDMAGVPMDEFLAFRTEQRDAHSRYMREARGLLQELRSVSPEAQQGLLTERRQRIADYGADLERQARHAWKQPTSLAAAVGGVAWSAATMDPTGAIIGMFSLVFGLPGKRQQDQGAYSCLFNAARRQ